MFISEFGRIEAEAFLTIASELVEEDGIVSAEEDSLLEEYKNAFGIPDFSYDSAAEAAARDTLAQLNETGKRKVYMEIFSFAVCDHFEHPSERRTLNELRDALGLDPRIVRKLEECVVDLNSVYAEIERALEEPAEPKTSE